MLRRSVLPWGIGFGIALLIPLPARGGEFSPAPIPALRYAMESISPDPHGLTFQHRLSSVPFSLDANLSPRLALRGNAEMLLSVDQPTLEVAVFFQNLHIAAEPDSFQITVYDTLDRAVFTGMVKDETGGSAVLVIAPPEEKRFTIPLPEPGIYRIRTTLSRNYRYDLITDAPYSAWLKTLEFLDSSKSLDLFFSAPSENVEITFSTLHDGGIHQTVTLFDSIGRAVADCRIEEINKLYSLRSQVPQTETEKLWRLHIPAQDLVVRSPQVNVWFLRPEEWFDFALVDQLLQPRRLEMVGIPGSAIPFRYTLVNPHSGLLRVFPEWTQTDGLPVALRETLSPVAINGSSQAIQYFHVQVPVDRIAGTTAAFTLRLRDEKGNVLAASLAILSVTQPAVSPPDGDYLSITSQRLEAVRKYGKEGPDSMRRIYEGIIDVADHIVADHLLVPEQEAEWIGNYVCDGIGDGNDDPNDGDGAPLIFDPLRPGVYLCSIDGRRYQGQRYESGWYGYFHYETASRLRALGLAYALEPRRDYAALAREMLLAYADRYNSWPLDDYQGLLSVRAARIMTETLGEANWLLYALIGYDFTRRDPVYSPNDRAHIEQNLIAPAVKIIQGNLMGTSNWQAWHDAAVGLAGYVLSRPDWVDWAVQGPNGLDYLKTNAIREDGLWWEGSIGYHFYALEPLHDLLEALESHGRPAFDNRIRSAFASVLALLQPDGSFPRLNDSGEEKIVYREPAYEHAHAHYDDPLFEQVMTFLYDAMGYPRDSMDALFFGKEYQSQSLDLASSLKGEMGLAILRTGNALNDLVALMDYGPMGMTHGHYDKLHLSLFGQGDTWLPDLGTGNVAAPEHTGWFRHTLGHNTILLGEQSQQADTEAERPIGFYSVSLPVRAMQAAFGPPVYPEGSRVRRTVLMPASEYVVVIDDVQGGPSPYDFVFHSAGNWFSQDAFITAETPAGWSSPASSYRFLSPPRGFNDSRPQKILERITDGETRIESRKEYGFNDHFENVNDWVGNVNLSNDTTEGGASLSWIIVPRDYQSIGKEFLLLDSHRSPDRLVFDFKVESNAFSRLLLQIEDVPTYRNALYEVARGDQVEVGKWQRAEIDLTRPETSYGSNRLARTIQFVLTGTGNADHAFRIFFDNLQAYEKGNLLQPEVRGLQFLFPGGIQTKYFLASGPSTNPPRVHPVVLARRESISQTQHITVLEPFLQHSHIRETRFAPPGTLEILFDDREDTLAFDPESNRYSYHRSSTATSVHDWTIQK